MLSQFDSTLSGLNAPNDPSPRVARPSQPWAEGFNPFGIVHALTIKIIRSLVNSPTKVKPFRTTPPLFKSQIRNFLPNTNGQLCPESTRNPFPTPTSGPQHQRCCLTQPRVGRASVFPRAPPRVPRPSTNPTLKGLNHSTSAPNIAQPTSSVFSCAPLGQHAS
jgi:hypothetical protein